MEESKQTTVKKTNISLTDDEVSQLIQLLDVALRAQGLMVAPNVISFVQKLKSAKEGI